MPNTGLLYATAATTGVYETGLFLWTNPSNITGNDNAYTESYASLIAGNTHYIFPTFTHDISAGYTIDGIVAAIDRYAGNDNGDGASDEVVRLYINNVVVGNNKAIGGFWPTTRAWSTDYGGVADLWGISVSPTDTIGLAISADFDGHKDDVFIYNVRMTIYYTASSSNGHFNIISGNNTGPYYNIIEAA